MKKLLLFLWILFVSTSSLYGCTTLQSHTKESIQSKKLVELYVNGLMPYKSPFPLLELEKNDSYLSTISYEPDDAAVGVGYSKDLVKPSKYGFMHLKSIASSMSLQLGFPLSMYQRNQYARGIPSKEKGGYDWNAWMESSIETMKKFEAQQQIWISSFELKQEKNAFVLVGSLDFSDRWNQDHLSNLRYSLFLKADRIYYHHSNDETGFVENLAYDLVPLKGDIKEEYDGIGFPLFSSSRELPIKENLSITLSTEPFTIPFIEGFTEEQQPKWSLHLILNDGTDMSKNLYSWSFPIEIEEKS